MGETILPIDVALEEFTPEEQRLRHLDTLRFFVFPPSGCEDRLPLDCLQGRALDISNKNGAGVEALRDLGISDVREICLPTTNLYYIEEEREKNRKELIQRLGYIPDSSVKLVTIFDHSDRFIATQAAREIERILVPGGQCLITYREMGRAPRDDGDDDKDFPEVNEEIEGPVIRGLLALAYLGESSDLFYTTLYSMGDRYAPNLLVRIYTKPGGRIEDV
jgi:hypothetical protein